ncbi:MAG: glycosyltransferase family 4 protein [Fimbriimonadaceae bacterium]|nr:glycosyltransferase family 4 protein [Fimbriimonadaceae bacterium]
MHARPLRIGVSAVLLDTRDGYRKAGIGRYVMRMLDGLAERGRGHRYEVYVPAGMPLEDRWLAGGLRFHEVSFSRRPQRVWWEFAKPPYAIAEHGLDAWFSMATGLPCRCSAKRVVMIHDLVPVLYPEFFKRRKAVYQRWALAYACRNADLVLTNSEATARDIRRVYGRQTPIAVTPLGPGNDAPPLAPEGVSRARLATLGVAHQRFLFTLGTLEPRKNLRRLIEALAVVRRQPSAADVGLVVAGAPGWRESDIGEFIAHQGLNDAITFLGYVPDEDLPALFAAAEAFVFPSLYEGFGIPVLEAMRAGAPVLSGDHAAMKEVGGDACLYFDAASVASIAETISRFLAAPERQARAARGFAQAEGFDWRRTVDLTLDAIEACVRNPERRKGV